MKMTKKQIKEEGVIFNKEVMKKQILEKYERNNKKINNYFKLVLIPISLVIIVGGLILLNYQQVNNNLFENNSYIDQENNINLQFNKVNNLDKNSLDVDVKINYINMPWPDILKGGINLPDDLKQMRGYAIFTKDLKTEEYTYLNCYVNDDKNRNIRMAFSKNDKPLRDYYFKEENAQKSNINDYELIIYQYKEIFFVEFTYQGYNFDIETENITKEELIALLCSIIK